MYSYDSSSANQQNEDSGIEKELLNIFEACNENGTDSVKVSELIDKIKFFLHGSENTQEILAVVKLKLDPHGNKTFISKEYFIQCVSEWLNSKQHQQQGQETHNGGDANDNDDDSDDNVFFSPADINEDEGNCSFRRGLKNRQNIYHSTPIVKKSAVRLHKPRTIDVYLSQPDSLNVSIEAHTALENEIKDMKQDLLVLTRERDQLEMTLSDLRNHITLIEKKNSMNESLLTQTVNKLKTEVEKKHELEKCNEELVKMNGDTEREMALVNKKFTSLVKTCEEQRAQNCILEQMLSDETEKNRKQHEELEKIIYEHNEEKEVFTDKISLLMEEITQKNFAKLNLEKQNAELQKEINSQVTVTQNLRLELLKCKSSITKAEEKYMQMKLSVDHWLKNFGDIQKNMKGSLGSPEEISLFSTDICGFSPVKYENSLMAEIGTELDDKNENESNEDCILYETLSTQTEFVGTKQYKDSPSQTEDTFIIRNKRRRVCEEAYVHDSLTDVYLSQVIDHWTQTIVNDAVDSASQTDNTSKRTCNVGCGDDISFDISNEYSVYQSLLKSSHRIDASTQTGEPSDGFQYQNVCKELNTSTRRGKKWIWFGMTSVTFIMIFYLLFHTVTKWSCNSPCCQSGQYLLNLKKLFLSRNRNAVPV